MEGNYLGLPAPEPKRQRRFRIWPLAVLVLVVFFGFSSLGYCLARFLAYAPIGSALPLIGSSAQPVNILVLGSDQRENENSRADTMMLLFVDPAVPHVGVLSIPRDTYVNVPGHGSTKINHAHVYGGPQLAVATVESFLGVPVDNYVEINFEAFAGIVDALGGIELDVDQRMYRPVDGIDLQPGRQRLNGEDALAFVRYRDYPEGDIERIRHQQYFLRALADQALSLRGVLRSPQLLQQLYTLVKTDLAPTEMLTVAKSLRNLDVHQVSMAMLPGTPRYINRVSYYVAERDEVQATLAELQTPPPASQAQAKEQDNAENLPDQGAAGD